MSLRHNRGKEMLRKLEKKDAPLMIEWMHDPDVNCNFRADFAHMTLEQSQNFVEHSFDEESQNFAFVDENDEYMGTISLKHISETDKNAEYAVVTRKCAQGTGIAYEATMDILEYAFEKLGLHRVYLNVLEENVRANKFYKKCGFRYEGTFQDHLCIQESELVWNPQRRFQEIIIL